MKPGFRRAARCCARPVTSCSGVRRRDGARRPMRNAARPCGARAGDRHAGRPDRSASLTLALGSARCWPGAGVDVKSIHLDVRGISIAGERSVLVPGVTFWPVRQRLGTSKVSVGTYADGFAEPKIGTKQKIGMPRLRKFAAGDHESRDIALCRAADNWHWKSSQAEKRQLAAGHPVLAKRE